MFYFRFAYVYDIAKSAFNINGGKNGNIGTVGNGSNVGS